MKLHIQLNDDTAEVLLNEGLAGLPHDFAETIRGNRNKSGEVIKLVIQRHLARLFDTRDRETGKAKVEWPVGAEGDEAFPQPVVVSEPQGGAAR